jgi:hypothetical protein
MRRELKDALQQAILRQHELSADSFVFDELEHARLDFEKEVRWQHHQDFPEEYDFMQAFPIDGAQEEPCAAGGDYIRKINQARLVMGMMPLCRSGHPEESERQWQQARERTEQRLAADEQDPDAE